MDFASFVTSILPHLYALVAIAAVFALVQIGRAAGNASRQLDELAGRVNPILEKADVSVDALNAELLRLDAILTDVEEMSSAAASATRAVETVTNAPLEMATNIADRIRHRFKEFRAGSGGENHASEYVEVEPSLGEYWDSTETKIIDTNLS